MIYASCQFFVAPFEHRLVNTSPTVHMLICLNHANTHIAASPAQILPSSDQYDVMYSGNPLYVPPPHSNMCSFFVEMIQLW
jgi:hypothetical protein